MVEHNEGGDGDEKQGEEEDAEFGEGLDPSRTAGKTKSDDRRKRQDNWFSDPVFVFGTLEYGGDL